MNRRTAGARVLIKILQSSGILLLRILQVQGSNLPTVVQVQKSMFTDISETFVPL